jgi:hypothetical protein
MGPRFFPTYKKVAGRGATNYRDPDWPSSVYITQYKEPFYKGGKVQERIPSWTDRIQYHSLADRSGELAPEPYDPDDPDNSPHNYHAVRAARGRASERGGRGPHWGSCGVECRGRLSARRAQWPALTPPPPPPPPHAGQRRA